MAVGNFPLYFMIRNPIREIILQNFALTTQKDTQKNYIYSDLSSTLGSLYRVGLKIHFIQIYVFSVSSDLLIIICVLATCFYSFCIHIWFIYSSLASRLIFKV